MKSQPSSDPAQNRSRSYLYIFMPKMLLLMSKRAFLNLTSHRHVATRYTHETVSILVKFWKSTRSKNNSGSIYSTCYILHLTCNILSFGRLNSNSDSTVEDEFSPLTSICETTTIEVYFRPLFYFYLVVHASSYLAKKLD